MVYDSTTSVPQNEGQKGKFQSVEVTQTDTFPYVIWTPPVGKRVVIDDIITSVWERSGNRAFFDIEIFKGSSWQLLVRVGQIGNGINTFSHGFQGKLAADKNNGVGNQNRIRVRKPPAANTTQFDLTVVVIGREV